MISYPRTAIEARVVAADSPIFSNVERKVGSSSESSLFRLLPSFVAFCSEEGESVFLRIWPCENPR